MLSLFFISLIDDNTLLETEQATAPPAAEVLTPEATGPATESVVFDPLSNIQTEQGTEEEASAEVLTPEANAPPTESLAFDPLSNSQTKQETQEEAAASLQQPQQSLEATPDYAAMTSAPLIAVAPEEDPLSVSGSKVQGEETDEQVEGTKETTCSEIRKIVGVRTRTVAWPTESMQPMSQQELQYYYFNSMLTNQDAFVEDFVKVRNLFLFFSVLVSTDFGLIQDIFMTDVQRVDSTVIPSMP